MKSMNFNFPLKIQQIQHQRLLGHLEEYTSMSKTVKKADERNGAN
jgi:hypothetical protein